MYSQKTTESDLFWISVELNRFHAPGLGPPPDKRLSTNGFIYLGITSTKNSGTAEQETR